MARRSRKPKIQLPKRFHNWRHSHTLVKQLLGEFGEFVLLGSALDIAVGIILGTSFAKLIDAIVYNLVTPVILSPILWLLKIDDIAKLKIGAVPYGVILSEVINFLIVAGTLFTCIRPVNRYREVLRRSKEKAVANATEAALVDDEVSDRLA